MPSKYIFRSKSDDDYGKMDINLPAKYLNRNFLLQIKKETEVVYSEVVSSSKTSLKHLTPGVYKILLIKDIDGDGGWTTGQLKSKLHAEEVIPYHSPINMKAGWEHVINFEAEKKESPTKSSAGN